jgi:hypothetical protein
MEYTTLAVVLVLLLTAAIVWVVIAAARKGGGPPDGQPRSRERSRAPVRPPAAGEPDVESERLANRPPPSRRWGPDGGGLELQGL